jgi:protein-S-isoprenylcysteine O-methyltransferase Ste14
MTPEPPSGTCASNTEGEVPLGRKRARAALGSALFLAAAPGVAAGLVPYLLTGWNADHAPLVTRIAGAALIAAGAAVILEAFARFALHGLGTPAPIAPTERLVVTGLYRYVRNPMYLAVASTILGQWLLLGRPVLLAYAIVFGATVFAFVRGYEEPTLRARYGEEYERYRAAVPGWWPRRIAKT